MNLRLLASLGMGGVTTYMGLVMLIGHFRTPPKSEPPLPRNFTAHAEEVIDETTGEKTVYREITVTTKLNDSPPPQTATRPVKGPEAGIQGLQIGVPR